MYAGVVRTSAARRSRFVGALAAGLFSLGWMQSGTAKPQFEVVSIKVVRADYSNGASMSAGLVDPSTWRAHNANVYQLIAAAYGPRLFSDPNRLVGVPKSLDNTAFEIQARIPAHARAIDLPLMLQDMLAERYRLQIHTEMRPMPAAVITVAAGGPKLARDLACEDPNRPIQVAPPPGRDAGGRMAPSAPACGGWTMLGSGPGRLVETFRGVTISQFAEDIARGNLEVVDQTHLAGVYDFTLSYPVEDMRGAPRDQWDDIEISNQRAEMAAFTKELGLRITLDHPTRQPVKVYVVDHVETPTSN